MRTVTLGAAVLLLLAAIASTRSAGEQPAKPASEPALELELARKSLENVDDKAGRWQFVGGEVMQDGKHAANYATVLRVIKNGTEEQNTAAATTTIFFLGEKPPQNITLQGSHDCNSGEQIGSVSAASSAYSAYIGRQFLVSGGKKPKLAIGAAAAAPRGL